MFYAFLFALFYTSSVFADFQNDLPSNFPTPAQTHAPEKNSTPSTQSETKTPKSKKHEKSPPANQTNAPIQLNSTDNSAKNQGGIDSEVGNHDSNAPVFFSGNRGDGSRVTGILNLVGNAVVKQDDTTLKSNKAQIFSYPGTLPTPGTSRIQRAVATGNVRIFKKATPTAPEIKATGDETEFLVPERILILRGKAKVWRTNEYLNGDTIKINLNSGDIDVIRPEGTFDPKSAQNGFGKGSGSK